MAITATLVFAGHNRLRYLINSTVGSESVEIQCVGGPSPDLLTDSLAGPLKQIARVKTQGYGLISVGGISSQAEARALLQSEDNATLVGNPNKPTAICRLERRHASSFTVDAIQGTVDPTTPSLLISNVIASGGVQVYLDVEILGSIGA